MRFPELNDIISEFSTHVEELENQLENLEETRDKLQ